MAHTARKRFGQNFLRDDNIIDNILGSLTYAQDQHWVEIGPGQGALTELMLRDGVQLDVVELDRDLVKFLGYKFREYDNLTIHSSDALRFDFSSLASQGEKLHILGNLPYNISTPLMFHLLENIPRIADMTFMLQKEVVDRICAAPGSKKYGRLSVMMQYYCNTEHLFDVPPESFNPAPKVMSSIVRLEPFEKPPVEINSVKSLNTVVTAAFSQRRKTLRNSLRKLITEEHISALGITPSLRAETLPLSDFAKISNFVDDNPLPEEE